LDLVFSVLCCVGQLSDLSPDLGLFFSGQPVGCFCFLPPFVARFGGLFDLVFNVLRFYCLFIRLSPVSVLFFSGQPVGCFLFFAPILPASADILT